MSWFPAPDESPTADSVQFGSDSTTLLNGFASINGSVYGHRKYELNWSYLNRDQAELFSSFVFESWGRMGVVC